MGLGYAVLRCDTKKANRHFGVCVRRDPRHISALNNLALSEIRLKKYTQALSHWRTALELAPAAPEVIQNIGRLLHLAKQGRRKVPPTVQRRFSDLYSLAAVSADAKEFNGRTGWLYMGYYASFGEQSVSSKDPKQRVSRSKTRLVTMRSGTGFVVHPEYILTNRHVVKGCAGLQVVVPGEKKHKLPASVVGVANGPDNDLAVIHCKGLTAPPVPFIKADFAPRGTEIMVLGFPGMGLGADPSLKSTRGVIAGLPDESFGTYSMDAISNPGNSGGPICDETGSVLGILKGATGPATRLRNEYTLGIPHSLALPLLKKWIPGYKQLPPNTEKKEWPDVDGLVSHSTALILVQSRVSTGGISSSTKAKHPKRANALEDCWCMTCCGCETVECPNRNCKNGTIGAKRQELVGVDPISRSQIYRNVPFRIPCKTCRGKGAVRCQHCDRGIDKSLR